MVVPSTIFVAIGVITAASLTGIFSFITLINQKEGKVSEFRQNWIDALREDISKLLSSFDRISSAWQLIQIEEEDKNTLFKNNTWMPKFHELTKDDVAIFSECHNRILLRLNKKDDKELIDKLNIINSSLSKTEVLFDKDAVKDQTDGIIFITQDLLKTEWEVVKAGEKAYINTKRATKIIIAILLLTLPTTYFLF